jgi:hypothetical protein
MIPLKKPNLRRCFNFPVTATYDKYVSFVKNFAPCISGFLSGIISNNGDLHPNVIPAKAGIQTSYPELLRSHDSNYITDA